MARVTERGGGLVTGEMQAPYLNTAHSESYPCLRNIINELSHVFFFVLQIKFTPEYRIGSFFRKQLTVICICIKLLYYYIIFVFVLKLRFVSGLSKTRRQTSATN